MRPMELRGLFIYEAYGVTRPVELWSYEACVVMLPPPKEPNFSKTNILFMEHEWY